jgi:hypothetical protein
LAFFGTAVALGASMAALGASAAFGASILAGAAGAAVFGQLLHFWLSQARVRLTSVDRQD